ncbi:MAG: YeeE/YedE thiosulfate transporter family protein [Gammaproteobacteria bacterium]|nr:YeeE/YedE thiosulfate transporter family protein [Gammaproteobacteria bacterium]
MTEYWTWWQGGLALGSLVVLFRLVLHRPLGVSGSWLKLASTREEIKSEQQAQAFVSDRALMDNALYEATLAEFGDAVPGTTDLPDPGSQKDTNSPRNSSASFGQHAVFLFFIFIGALLFAFATDRFSLDLELSQTLTQLSHGLASSWVYLLLGGVMVGFGTQMASGCTSGHGLSGCAQGSPTSVVATFIFFICAVTTAVFFSMVLPQ